MDLSNDVLQARANVKNNKYKDVYGIVHKAFAPAIVGMSRDTNRFVDRCL